MPRGPFTLALTLLVTLVGCDGHLRLLHLRPRGAEKPPWNIARVIIDIEGNEDVVGIVSRVADELGLTNDPGAPHAWSIREPSRNNTFTMGVSPKEAGSWEISLSDWPNATRSDYSVRAERAVRETLRRNRTRERILRSEIVRDDAASGEDAR